MTTIDSNDATDENTEKTEAKTETPRDAHSTLVDALYELGARWTEFGMSVSRQALVHGAHTLEQTARTLDALAAEIARKQQRHTQP